MKDEILGDYVSDSYRSAKSAELAEGMKLMEISSEEGKSSDVIYLQICEKCESENSYVGQTSQKFSDRNSGHRSKFN